MGWSYRDQLQQLSILRFFLSNSDWIRFIEFYINMQRIKEEREKCTYIYFGIYYIIDCLMLILVFCFKMIVAK